MTMYCLSYHFSNTSFYHNSIIVEIDSNIWNCYWSLWGTLFFSICTICCCTIKHLSFEHYIDHPPSMMLHVPVVYPASSDAKYNTLLAISSAVPSLFIFCLAIKSLRACSGSGDDATLSSQEGVWTVPGQMQFTRIPASIKSIARDYKWIVLMYTSTNKFPF